MIKTNKSLKKFLLAEALKLRQKNLINSTPSKYFSKIGSIPLEDLFYKDQIRIKKEALNQIYKNIQIELVPSDKIYNYRFRMDYVCSFNPFHEPKNRFGQRKAGKYNWVIDMDEAILFNKKLFKDARKLFNLAIYSGINIYDLVKHSGDLRYIVLKAWKNESMITFVSKNTSLKLWEPIMKEASSLGFKSVNLHKQDSRRDTSEGKLVHYLNKKTIKVKLKNFSFYVSPNSFFQNNIKTFEKIIKFIELEIKKENSYSLIDLYSGVGTIGILLSKYFNHIYSFEINPVNILYAKKNFKLNNIYSYNIIEQDLTKDLKNLEQYKDQIVLVDPPRAGLEKKGINQVLKLNPKKIIYISCNPVSQFNDIEVLKAYSYKLTKVKGFDMFPQTYHIESVAILEKN